jgi:hypothetical protein
MNWETIKHELKLMWDMAKTAWAVTPPKCKYALYGGVAVLVFMLVVGAARAENAPHSNFGVVNSLSTPGTAFACYLADSRGDMSPGSVHTCLILQMVPPGVLATFGQVTFCTMTGTVQDKPQWSCGKYEDMYKLSMGV